MPKSIAERNSIPLEKAQEFVRAYYDRYSGLKKFQDDLKEYCNNNLKPSPYMMKNGYPAMQATWQSPTGRLYTFIQQPTPKFMQDKGIYGSISPQQIANYPMQGFATGDVVPEMLGRLLDHSSYGSIIVPTVPLNTLVLPINTIHDSILFDVNCDDLATLQTIGGHLKHILENVQESMKDTFGIDIDLPFKVDVEYGPTWAEMKSLF